MNKKPSKFRNIGIFTIIGIIFGGLFGYFCTVYYLLFIDTHLNIPNKFHPLKSFLLLVFIYLIMVLFSYLGNCLDDESRAVKEFKNFTIIIISLIVGTIVYSTILLVIISMNGNFGFMSNNGIIWSVGMIIILCSYFLIKKFLVKEYVK